MTLNDEFFFSTRRFEYLYNVSNEDKCIAYGLKQHSIYGNNNNSKPWFNNFEKEKWKQWKSHYNKDIIETKKEYILFINTLISKYKKVIKI